MTAKTLPPPSITQAAAALATPAEPRPLASVATALAKPGQLHSVQMLRAVAALSVLIHHVFEESHALFAPAAFPTQPVLVGASGVDLFFAISGFIMLHTSWRQAGEPGAGRVFLVRRLVRIMPLYWVCLALFFVAKGAGLYRGYTPTPYGVFSSLALLPSHQLALTVAWTLVYELYFYLLFAAWLRAPRRALLLGVPLSGLLIGLLALQLPPGAVRQFLTYPVSLEFAFGLLIAWRYRHAGPPRNGPWIALLGLGLLALSVHFTAHVARAVEVDALRYRFLYWGVPTALILYGSLGNAPVRARAGRWLSGLGDASYAIYLTHAFVMTAYARALKDAQVAALLPAPAWVALVTCFAVLLGWVTHRCVERPLSRALQPWVEKVAAR